MVNIAMVARTCAFACWLVAMGARAESWTCPPSLEVNESLAKPVADGWAEIGDRSPRYLAGVTFYDGQPERQQSITPTADVAGPNKRGHRTTWNFGDSGTAVWLACRYAGSSLLVSRPLPTRTKVCVVTSRAGGVIDSIDCR